MARMTLASIRAELDTLARHYGCTITIERTDKDGNTDTAGRYVNVIVPSGVTSTGIICNNLTDAYNTIRQYLAQAGIVPSTDTFPANNLTAAVAAHHRRFVASLNDPQPEPPATTIDIASKYGTFTYQMVAWRCADRSNGLASYPTWHETLDAHEWLDYRPLTTDRIKRIVTTWPAQNIATVELDNGYWFQVRYETIPTPAPEPYEPGVFGGAHPGDDEETIEESAGAYLVSLVNTYGRGMVTNRGIPMLFTTIEDAVNAAHQFMQNDAAQLAYDVIEMPSNTIVASGKAPDHCPAPTPDYATIPAIGGGSHEADTQPAKKARPRVWFACPGCGKSVHTSRGITINGETWHKACHEPQPAKQRTKATSQKRDNQRAERAALNEAYKAHAAGKASEVSDILTAFGFAIISTKDNDGTPVTIWQDTNPQEIEGTNPDHIAHATIKQTPYSLRIYNGQPPRLPRHGDAELINRVEHGWCACGEARGYAAGLADAILRLIETPDPYMQALDAIEAGDCSPAAYPEGWIYEDELPENISDAEYAERFPSSRVIDGVRMFPPVPETPETIEELNTRHDRTLNRWKNSKPGDYRRKLRKELDEIENLIRKIDPENYRVQWQEVTFTSKQTAPAPLPALVLHGGQPSYDGPWQVPAISGGAQEHDTVTLTNHPIRFQVYRLKEDGDTLDTKIAGKIETRDEARAIAQEYSDANNCDTWIYEHRLMQDISAEVIHPTCPHDQHETGARFCSQCGHDAHPDAPQPTDTGTSHDVTTPSDPDTGDRVTIEHTPEGGTIATGDTRPQSATLKMCGFKWSRMLGAWYIPNSRDRRADMYKINKTAQALRDNHASVTLDIDDRAVDPATVEANRAERLADRHAALHRKAEKLDAEASARFGAADTLADMIPFGQPILVGHHSEKRHRAHVAKIERNMDKGVEAFRASEDAEHRATAGERQQAKRMTAPATMRRIEKLETERRDLERRAARGQVGTIGGPTIAERLSDNAEHLAYWRAHLATLEAQGVKVWRPEDFTKGDVVLDQFGLVTVNRVNKKSLSVTTHYTFDHGREWAKTITFDDIKGKATPEQAERFRTA